MKRGARESSVKNEDFIRAVSDAKRTKSFLREVNSFIRLSKKIYKLD